MTDLHGLLPGGRFGDWAPGTPRYVVADVDGTLIAGGPSATPAVVEAVAAAQAAGASVGVATGRPPAGALRLQRQLGADGPHIVHNGAQVDAADGTPIASWPLERDAVRALVAFCLEQRLYAEFFCADAFYVTERREAARPTWEGISGEPAGLVAQLDLATAPIIKGTVVAFDAEAEADPIIRGIEALGLAAEGAPSGLVPGALFINATAPAAGKGSALEHTAAHLGLELADVVAIGDGHNDRSMLLVAGTAIAMGQAPAEVQAAAHLVAPHVDADGVADALRAVAAWRDS